MADIVKPKGGGVRAAAKKRSALAELAAAAPIQPGDVTARFSATQIAGDEPADVATEALRTLRETMRLAAANEGVPTSQRLEQVIRAARATYDASEPEARCAALAADLRDAHAEAAQADERLRAALSEIRDLRAQIAAYAVAHTEGDTAPASGASVQ